MPIDKFKKFYKTLNVNNIDSLEDIYHKEITFIDPFHKIQGLPALKGYFNKLYENLNSIEFIYGDTISQGNQHVINWCMQIKHRKLNHNKLIKVYGCTHIKYSHADNEHGHYQEKVIYHCDYFDAGSLLYEQLPLIGSIIKWIKGKF